MLTSFRAFIRHNFFWLAPVALFVIAGLAYLPLVASLGYTKDDWYLIYDAHSQGAAFFQQIYSIDRPARGYVMQFIYSLFGDRILYYHLAAWFYRSLAAAALYWALTKGWPRREPAHFIVSVLFLLYPGFLSQINPIDYQSQLLSLCLALLSIAFTVQSLQTQQFILRLLYSLLAVILGLAYLPLVEYFIGFEVLRLVFIYQLSAPQKPDALTGTGAIPSLKTAMFKTIQAWLPFASIPALFLVWRLFFFQTERRATDASIQLGQLFSSPLTGIWWLISLLQDAVKAAFLAWAVPVYNIAFGMRLRDSLIGLALSAVILIIVLALAHMETGAKDKPDWRGQFLIMGIGVVLAGLLPVIIVNRRADFGDYSRYLLASAAGTALLITALIYFLENRRVQIALISLLVLGASLTHYANAVQASLETRSINDFWWQVSWRVPALRDGVTLLADYPVAVIQEDYFVWGPANLIYHPEKQNNIPLEIKLPAAVLTDDVVLQVLSGKGKETQLRRGNNVSRDFANVLVLTQASPSSCVRIIDGKFPELSMQDQQRILLVASASRMDNVLANAPQTASAALFGPEPAHGWCYYYQKAALARQQGDWKSVAALGEKALAEGFYPSDKIEWLPFIQAYTVLGQKDKLHRFVSIMGESPFIQKQACSLLSASTTNPDMLATIQESFCK